MPTPDLQLREVADLRYLVSVPPRPAASPRSPLRSLPVLCFLHGYHEAAPLGISFGLMRHGPLRTGNCACATEDFIVVAPQLPHAGDNWLHYQWAVMDAVSAVQRNEGGDPDRTYLTGFSFGGNGVFDLALVQSDFWAALWSVDPTRVPRQDPGLPVWLSIGTAARAAKYYFIPALRLEPAGRSASGDRLYLDEGEDHVGSAVHAYRDERTYAWLLSKSLSKVLSGSEF
jgi:hypothetical protein